MTRAPALELRAIEKRIGGGTVLRGASLELASGEALLLLGASGAGKTTLLRIAAGLEREDAGEVLMGGKTVSGGRVFLSARERGVGIVFHEPALVPHMSALANVLFALGGSGLTRAERLLRATDALERACARAFSNRRPAELSRGEAQRVALARAIARRPRLLLLDEPFAHLDPRLRDSLRGELDALRRDLGLAVLAAAHLGADYVPWDGRAAILSGGRIAQVGTVEDLYARPVSREVAELTGPASIVELDGARVALRPEQLAIAIERPGSIRARVVGLGFAGGRPVLRLEAEGDRAPLLAVVDGRRAEPGMCVTLEVRGEPARLP